MTKQLKKRPIEKELKFLADFEIYGVLMFAGMYFAIKYIIDMDCGKNAFKLNWISFYPLLVFSIIVVEGSFYWRNKLKMVRRKKALSNIDIYETVNGRLLVIDPLKKLFTGTGKRSQLRKEFDAFGGHKA
ncbi:MAG: hypothetical protein K2L82_10890 [Lachnospiraceae bacterium]|nr:hypothetical protein [Lachnospiraceae bacterium]